MKQKIYKKQKNKFFISKYMPNIYLKIEKKQKYYYFIDIAFKFFVKKCIIAE